LETTDRTGNCVEIAAGNSRIILDVGMPLAMTTNSSISVKPGRRNSPDMDLDP
jgi:hypothetical protein